MEAESSPTTEWSFPIMLMVTNPYSLAPVGEVPLRDWSFADRWLDDALRLHRDRENRQPAYQRIAILEKAAAIMRQRFDALALQIADEGGKPLVDARVEVERASDGVRLAASEIGALHGREIPMDLTAAGAGRLAFTTREPIGPVVAVSAFNHPLNLVVHQVAPAVAVGCPVILKPADDTPLSAEAFIAILHEAGLSEDRSCLRAEIFSLSPNRT